MGCGSSKGPGGELPPQAPYLGEPVEYRYVTIEATLDVKHKFKFFKPEAEFNSTSIDTYFHKLEAMYAQGYKMLAFFPLNDSASYKTRVTARSNMKVTFHGIFRKLFHDEDAGRCSLNVDKSFMVNTMFRQVKGVFTPNAKIESSSDNNHVLQTIQDVSARGGRLVAVELSGLAWEEMALHRQNQNNRNVFKRSLEMPPMQVSVDIFYEMPSPSGKQNYQIVNSTMRSVYVRGYSRGKFNSTIDWQQIMTQYLGSGWRLVDLFEDSSVSANAQSSMFTGAQAELTKNVWWIFENPESSMLSDAPRYEGTMVEHYFKMTIETKALGLAGVDMKTDVNYEPVLDHMGKYGWELVRILRTPDNTMTSPMKPVIHNRAMIFFQRRIA